MAHRKEINQKYWRSLSDDEKRIKYDYANEWAKNNRSKLILKKQQRKEWAVGYKGGKCKKCGYSGCMAALDFHHPNDDKETSVANILNYTIEKLKEELDKCELLCANCHREVEFAKKMKRLGLAGVQLSIWR